MYNKNKNKKIYFFENWILELDYYNKSFTFSQTDYHDGSENWVNPFIVKEKYPEIWNWGKDKIISL